MQQKKIIKPQLRKTKTDTTNYVDVQTGEILDTTQTYKEKLIGVNSSYTMLYNDTINSIVSLTPCAKSVIFVLISMYIRSGFFEIGNGLCSEMATITGYSIKSVRNSITELVSTGFIIKSARDYFEGGFCGSYSSWVTGYDLPFLSRWRLNHGSESLANFGSIGDLFKCRPSMLYPIFVNQWSGTVNDDKLLVGSVNSCVAVRPFSMYGLPYPK